MRPFAKQGSEHSTWLVIIFIIAILILLIFIFVLGDGIGLIKDRSACETNGGKCSVICGPGEQTIKFTCPNKGDLEQYCCFDPEKLLYGDETDKEAAQQEIAALEADIIRQAAANAGISAVDLQSKVKTGEVDLYNLNEYPPCNNKCDYKGYKQDLKQLDDLKEQLGILEAREKQTGTTGTCINQYTYEYEEETTITQQVDEGDVCWYGQSVAPHEGNDCGTDNQEPCYADQSYTCTAGDCYHYVTYYGFDEQGQPSTIAHKDDTYTPNPSHPCKENATGADLDELLDQSQTCTPPEPAVKLVKDTINKGPDGEELYKIKGFSNIICNEVRPNYKFDETLFTSVTITSSGKQAQDAYDDQVTKEEQALVRQSNCGSICSASHDLILKLADLNDYLEERDYYLTITQPFRTYEIQKCLFFQYEGDTSMACNPDNPPNGEHCAHEISAAIDVSINKGSASGAKLTNAERERVMCDNGFLRYGPEAWHYEYGTGSSNWERYQEQIGVEAGQCCSYLGDDHNQNFGHKACTA